MQSSDNELVKKVYDAQKALPVKDDWIYSVRETWRSSEYLLMRSRSELEKKEAFKKLVNTKIREASYSSLLQDKKGKLDNLSSHYGLKEYLSSDKITLQHKQLLLNLCTRMVRW